MGGLRFPNDLGFDQLIQEVDYGRTPILPGHPVGERRSFRYRSASGRLRNVGHNKKDRPRLVQEHVIAKDRWPKSRLYKAPPPPPSPLPPPPPGPPLRRSPRLAEKAAARRATRKAERRLERAAERARAETEAANPPSPPQPLKSETELNIATILGFDVDDHVCEVCKKFGGQCKGDACYAEFLRGPVRRFNRAVEVCEAGDMGLGLFLKPDLAQPIRKGEMLDQYVGELMPADGPGSQIDDYTYVFDLGGVAQIDSREKGNYTRFANHHCKPNVLATQAMIGRRQTILFRADRDLHPGEELFIHYGRGYFMGGGIRCRCNAKSVPHLPTRK
ncbi:hypothetical protein PG993_008579 [Apiospora rasikravindrae]|uniref:SET domain-containing protein n=1 Tax=Apiospora rasikravindrae TaxID=990691 RepID=A0ABR1T0S4_9PEZI